MKELPKTLDEFIEDTEENYKIPGEVLTDRKEGWVACQRFINHFGIDDRLENASGYVVIRPGNCPILYVTCLLRKDILYFNIKRPLEEQCTE